MNRILTAAAAFVTVSTMGISGASATIFAKDYHDAGVWNAYDDSSETYTMKFDDDGSKDGFWLVVSGGDNPKTNANEYAILYGDRASNRITAYTYDGENNADSFRTGQHLATYENVFSDGGNGRTMFALDVGDLNGAFDTAGWSGVEFGAQQGIWFHQSAGSQFAYNADGTISNYGFGTQMYLDKGNQKTHRGDCANKPNAYFCKTGTTPSSSGGGSVPAPGGLALLMVGFAGMRLRRKK